MSDNKKQETVSKASETSEASTPEESVVVEVPTETKETELKGSSPQQRFAATGRVYGENKLNKFLNYHVVVVGLGGVGSWAAEALARSGIGKITLIDHDDISESNINRQIHSMDSTIGEFKVEEMQRRIALINPDCKVNTIKQMLTEENCDALLLDKELSNELNNDFSNALEQKSNTAKIKIDYVVDAIDSVKYKAYLLAYCKRNRISVISTGGAGGLSDPTQITVTDLSKTNNDQLAAKTRYVLRSEYGFSRNEKKKFGIDCVYSTEQAVYPQKDGTVSYSKPSVKGLRLDCNYGYGSSVCVTSTFGMIAVAQLLQKIGGVRNDKNSTPKGIKSSVKSRARNKSKR